MDALDLAEVLAVLSVVAWAGRPLLAWREGPRVYLVLLGLVLGTATVVAASRPPRVDEADVQGRPARLPVDGYAGSSACRSCHPAEYASWRASYHRTMTQVPTPETLLAPWDGQPIEVGGRRYRPFLRDGRPWIEMPDPTWPTAGEPPRVERPITLSTGSHHQQDYWFDVEPGRAVAHLPIVYRIEEQRWLPNGSTFLQPPRPARTLARSEVGGWNRNCIQCHATSGRPRFGADGSVETTVAELGIACESCHGPGARHVASNRDPLRRHALRTSAERHDDTIVNPARLDGRRASEVCAQCHMVSTVDSAASHPEWNERGPAYRPGDVLAASRDVLLPGLDPDDEVLRARLERNPDFLRNRFWADGMVRVTGREMHGLLESPCAEDERFSCLTCHEMHPASDGRSPSSLADWADDQLAHSAAGRGDAVCASCHEALAADPARHSRHAAGSEGSRCMNCHMPYTTYGLLKAIRSHQISSPDVAATIETGRPNACNLCHLDRTLAWTADTLETWFDRPRPALPASESRTASSILAILQGDAGQRALAAWHFGWGPAIEASGGAAWMRPFLAHLLDDPYDAVRFVAARSLRAELAERLVVDPTAEHAPPYDFLASADARASARAAWLDRLADAKLPSTPRDAALLRQPENGRFDRARLESLARGRDDRPLELWE